MTTNHPPVCDWAADFDHIDPQWSADPYPIWDELRATCPVAHSERYGSTWLPVRHADVAAVAYDTEHFSSWSVVVNGTRQHPRTAGHPGGSNPPITSDPPQHAPARRVLLPPFSPKAVAALEPFTRRCCRQLLDDLAGRDVVDAAVDYAQHIPMAVTAKMLGFPDEDAGVFRKFIHDLLENPDASPEERRAQTAARFAYLDDRIAEHRAEPRDDLTSFLLDAELDGAKLTPEHVRGTLSLVLFAGIDTTWSAIGASLWHLAGHPEDRRRLGTEPMLMATAVEEFLRAYAPVTMARVVAADVDFAGHAMKAGDWVLLSFPAANRDPDMFADADEVHIDRARNRHAAFGLGIHRCIGSNLARMELRVALEEWMRHFAHFELADPDRVTWSAGQVRGPRSLPVRVVARSGVVGPEALP